MYVLIVCNSMFCYVKLYYVMLCYVMFNYVLFSMYVCMHACIRIVIAYYGGDV